MRRVALEATCRILLARVYLLERNAGQALVVLDAVAPDRWRALNPELQAQAHSWRARALDARGDRGGAQAEFDNARKLVMDLRGSLPEPEGSSFSARPEIRGMTER